MEAASNTALAAAPALFAPINIDRAAGKGAKHLAERIQNTLANEP